MPTPLHPQAKFDPIPPDLDLRDVVDQTPNFKWAQRVSRAQVQNLGQLEFEKLIQIHVIAGGKPLVIDGWESILPGSLFSSSWLEDSYNKKEENVRDISAAAEIPMTMGHYLRSMKQLANQWTPQNFRDNRRQRLYLKDIDCPLEWRDALQKIIHPSLFYLNENVTSASPTDDTSGNESFTSGKATAPAGDLMSSLPDAMMAENLMCYIGHEGTYTPAHKEMCATLGHNIMVEASSDEQGEKRGSSIWFMTESKDREVVREYFLSMLGHDIEIEKHFAQINAWKKAPFDVYFVEQRIGDFIIIPPLAAHQVWNRGTRTMKVAWNRTTTETLGLALNEALPKARLVCRDEQYKNKAIIYFTLQKYCYILQEMERQQELTQKSFAGIGRDIVRTSARAKQLCRDFKTLFNLFTEILVDEAFELKEKNVEFLPFDSCVTCSYCRSNIFNRFLTCKNCTRYLTNGDEDAYDVCMECYAMGRSCACLSGLQWCEQWSWTRLVDQYELWRGVVILNDGFIDLQTSPPPFEIARQKAGRKPVAQICQEALLRRPWKDITKGDYNVAHESDNGDVEEGAAKKPKRKQKKGELRRCHVCCHKDYSYRVHECTNPSCSEAYCYGVLYRAFDMMPQAVLESEHWQCPKCLGICSCGHCRRTGNTNAYTPRTTSLGHDTRPIADDRSVEALVDFRVHNLSWLKATGEESRSKDSRRMQRLRQQADFAKALEATGASDADQGNQNHHDGQVAGVDTSHVMESGKQRHKLESSVGHIREASSHIHTLHGGEDGIADGPIPEQHLISHDPPAVDDASLSPYPDLTIYDGHRIGMGYYEPDDAPDRILFDPYKEPNAASLQVVDHDVSDSVKKSIRAAKRKAKREKEDPDFVIGKSHHKRSRVSHPADFLESMDPALFDTTSSFPSRKDDNAVPSEDLLHTTSEPNHTFKISETALDKQRDDNELVLRHAKPLTSYIELDDVELEDAELGDGSEALNGDHSDTKNQEISAGGSINDPEMQPGSGRHLMDETGVDVQPRKRRGRPRKVLSSVVLMADNPVLVNISEPKGGRGRARIATKGLDTTSVNNSRSPALGSNSLAEASTHSITTVRRSHKSPNQTNESDSGQSANKSLAETRSRRRRNEETLVLKDIKHSKPAAKRGRGRPRGSGRAQQAHSAPQNEEFMSMAERMARRGKKFKIGKRRGTEPDRVKQAAKVKINTVEVAQSRNQEPSPSDSPMLDSLPLEIPASPCTAQNSTSVNQGEGTPPSPKRDRTASREAQARAESGAQTIVRLTDIYSSGDESNTPAPARDSPSSSSSESDIPAQGKAVHGNRGRGHSRGRGRGRGKGRGRPRSRKRG